MITGSTETAVLDADDATARSRAQRVLRHLDPVCLEPGLVLGLRLGQSRRFGETVLLRLRCEHLDHAGHF